MVHVYGTDELCMALTNRNCFYLHANQFEKTKEELEGDTFSRGRLFDINF